jgi:hypothetical protein
MATPNRGAGTAKYRSPQTLDDRSRSKDSVPVLKWRLIVEGRVHSTYAPVLASTGSTISDFILDPWH